MLYFDHCATTPPHKEVIQTVEQVMRTYYGNPSSLHRLGSEAEQLLKRAREVIAGALQVRPEEVIFTSCGTESNNLAIKGTALRYAARGRHIITSAVEHASVYECCRQLEKSGWEVTYLPVDASGAVRREALEEALRQDTVLVSLMHVNNEMGRIQPIEELAALVRSRSRAWVHVDAVQSVGKLPLQRVISGIDLLSVSAHKIYGPKGAGFLYRRKGVELEPMLAGGGQEFGIRSGTENVPLLAGMAKAVRMAVETQPDTARRLHRLRDQLVRCLADMPAARLNGSGVAAEMAPHIVNFSLPGYKAEVVVNALEHRGVCVSTRSACASGEERPSRVLLAMGLDEASARSGIRISLAAEHTEQQIDLLAGHLREVMAELAPPAGKERKR